MSLRILGGHLKGFKLNGIPESEGLRPTSVMLRRKIFDAHQDLEGKCFVDLCCGTGAMGFEALSRRAEEVILIESANKVIRTLEKNIQELSKQHQELQKKLTCKKMDALNWIKHHSKPLQTQWGAELIIFCDPPYRLHEIYEKTLTQFLDDKDFEGQLWIEADGKLGPPKEFWKKYESFLIKSYSQGDHFINLYKRILA